MSVFNRVVVGLDRSTTALSALRWVSNHIDDPSAIDVVHAGAPDPAIPADIAYGSVQSRDCPPAQALLSAACDLQADTIAIGPHGSGWGRGLGSVARSLLADSSLPTLIVDGSEPPRSPGHKAPVVACVGYGEPAIAAATWAADYAHDRDLPLVLLHAIAYRPVFPLDSGMDAIASYLGEGVASSWALDELKELGTTLHDRHSDLAISAHIEGSSVIKAVRNAGEAAELVVLGKRRGDDFGQRLGTPRLRRLVARSHVPTAVIPSGFGL